MQGFNKKYVHYCNKYKCTKNFKFKKPSLFWLLLIFDSKWQDTSINFVIVISAVKSANIIYNIVDCLFKRHYHIAINKKIDTKKLANLFVYHIWKLCSLSKSIILDHNTQFVNNFWKF